MVAVSAQDLFQPVSPKTKNNTTVTSHKWSCSCYNNMDVCNPTKCYRSANCGQAVGSEKKRKTMPAAVKHLKVGGQPYTWDCNCANERGYCSIAYCFTYCNE
mmetsp:Transcript_75893/g.150092  ORF Transcript_75893/g.150092 Transcript_75893/m.150092 type:complete len:102 (-) Transcript_75893:675-980(-)